MPIGYTKQAVLSFFLPVKLKRETGQQYGGLHVGKTC